ncbi:MAG: hypothetical protein ACPGJE_05805 [Wenzhouxiangellaceae bacterium]
MIWRTDTGVSDGDCGDDCDEDFDDNRGEDCGVGSAVGSFSSWRGAVHAASAMPSPTAQAIRTTVFRFMAALLWKSLLSMNNAGLRQKGLSRRKIMFIRGPRIDAANPTTRPEPAGEKRYALRGEGLPGD